MLGRAEAVSRATPGSGSPTLNPTRCECRLPWKKAPQLQYAYRDVSWLLDSGSWLLLVLLLFSRPRSFN